MTVELAQPFQWPEIPENKSPWHHELWQMREKKHQEQQQEQKEMYKGEIPLPSKQPYSAERSQLRSLADKMLAGKVKWENDVQLDPRWDDIVAQTEAKQGVKKEAEVRSPNAEGNKTRI